MTGVRDDLAAQHRRLEAEVLQNGRRDANGRAVAPNSLRFIYLVPIYPPGLTTFHPGKEKLKATLFPDATRKCVTGKTLIDRIFQCSVMFGIGLPTPCASQQSCSAPAAGRGARLAPLATFF